MKNNIKLHHKIYPRDIHITKRKILNKKQKIIIFVGILAILTFLIYKFYIPAKETIKSYLRKRGAYNVSEIITPEPKETRKPIVESPKPIPIPESTLIEIPFVVQAPFANWAVHEESCEEAALLMVHYYLIGQITFDGKTEAPHALTDIEMRKMKDWQVKNYGKEPDLTMEALGKFANDYYGYNYKVYKNIAIDDIKREIATGNPVIVPVMTHSLLNPYYGRESVYHNLVIKGYKPEGVITNDAGVKQGENYFYTWDVLFQAIDAQTPKIGMGREMVVITK